MTCHDMFMTWELSAEGLTVWRDLSSLDSNWLMGVDLLPSLWFIILIYSWLSLSIISVVHDLVTDVENAGTYQTMTLQATLTVDRKRFRTNSFYIFVVVKPQVRLYASAKLITLCVHKLQRMFFEYSKSKVLINFFSGISPRTTNVMVTLKIFNPWTIAKTDVKPCPFQSFRRYQR